MTRSQITYSMEISGIHETGLTVLKGHIRDSLEGYSAFEFGGAFAEDRKHKGYYNGVLEITVDEGEEVARRLELGRSRAMRFLHRIRAVDAARREADDASAPEV